LIAKKCRLGEAIPTVLTFLSDLYVDKRFNTRIEISVEKVDRSGFFVIVLS
jgi:hypothetical protein